MATPVAIDPKTGERIQGGVQIDPATGERVQAQSVQPVQPKPTAALSAGPSLLDMVKHPLNTLDNLAQPVSRPVNASVPEMVSADLQNVAAGGYQALRHPIDTVVGGVTSLLHPKQTFDYLNQNGPQAGAQMIGNSAVMGAAGEVAGKPAGIALEKAGNAMQDAGAGVMNRTVGSLQRDFKRGANPGAAYLSAGGGPALSMESLAGKASNLKSGVGKQIGNAIQTSTAGGKLIPVEEASPALNTPANSARSVLNGPGGTGNTAPIDAFQRSFLPSIEAAQANGGFTPADLFDIKRNVSATTNWSDPSQIGLKKVAQQTAGGIGGVLEKNVPELADLNPQYQGLTNFANRASLRAATHSSPLTSLYGKAAAGGVGALLGSTHGPTGAVVGGITGSLFDSVPAKSAFATGLYRGGRGAVAIGKGLQSLYGNP